MHNHGGHGNHNHGGHKHEQEERHTLVVILLAPINVETHARPDSHLVHSKVTNTILSAAYKVHSRLGPGLLERPYHVCLGHELQQLKVPFETEKLLPLEYEGLLINLGYRVDFLVEDSVIVEVKAVQTLLPLHEAQLISYLKLSKKRVGLLINFNVAHLRDGIRRRIVGYSE